MKNPIPESVVPPTRLLITLLSLSVASHAVPVTVPNGSFESPPTANFTQFTGAYSAGTGNWVAYGGGYFAAVVKNSGPNAYNYAPTGSLGSQYGNWGGGTTGAAFQDCAAYDGSSNPDLYWQAGRIYTMTVGVFLRADNAPGTGRKMDLRLYYRTAPNGGAAVLGNRTLTVGTDALTTGSLMDYTVTWTVLPGAPEIGKPISIWFIPLSGGTGGTGDWGFDNVRLNYEVGGDSDGDGLADIWETTYFIHAGEDPVIDKTVILARYSGTDDPDGDGLNNEAEETAGTNPTVADTDGDGLSDFAEINRKVAGLPAPTNPLLADTDGDGLLDGAETNTGIFVSAANSGTNPLVTDTDGDTFTDYVEIARGSNPFLSSSTPGASTPNPIVSLSAASLPAGPLASWANTGTIGSTFNSGAAMPFVSTVKGVKGVTFTGTEVLTGVAAPPVLTGNSARTITAWVYNPAASADECIISWGRRDGPNNTYAAFGHGTNQDYGALGQWGADADMGWGSSSNVKTGRWTYLVYTYDPASKVGTLYVNGDQVNQETFAAVLNTWGIDNTPFARPLPLRVGGSNAADGKISTVSGNASLTIASLRVFDHVSTGAELGFIDTDLDGIPDWYEVFYGFNVNVNDSALDPDMDTLSNLTEYQSDTNPLASDTDGDGLRDDYESNTGFYFSPTNTGTNPLLADSDGDGLLDGVEQYTGVYVSPSNTGTDPNVADTDLDGVNDGLEVLTYGTDPLSDADKDSDGLLDRDEILVYHTNPSLFDTDGDTYGDLAEVDAASDPNDPISTPANIVGYGGSLVHRFKLDETTGTVASDSSGAANGTIGSTVTLGQAGKDGTSFLFPATATVNSKVVLPAAVSPTGSSPFTMTAWIKLAGAVANGGQVHILSANNGQTGRWNLGVADKDPTAGVDAQLFWFHNGGLGEQDIPGFNFNDHVGEWIHVAITRSSTGFTTLYLNGVAHDIGVSKATMDNSNGMAIGGPPVAANSQFNGNIDEVRFYSGGLSPANFLALYNSYPDPYVTWATGYGLDPNGNGAPGADADGDGTKNRIEFLLGLIPVNGGSRFAATQTGSPSSGFTLTWPSQQGITFTVRSTRDLIDWTTVEATVLAAIAPSATTSWSSGPLGGQKKFYRIEFNP